MASTKGLLVLLTLLLAAAFLVVGGAAGRTQAKKGEAGIGVPRGYHRGGISGVDAHGSGCRNGCCGSRKGGCRCCANADEIPERMYRYRAEVHN